MEFNLTNARWQPLRVDSDTYSFKSYFDTDNFELLILDIRKFKLYILKHDRDQIMTIFKDLNPCLEAPLSKIILLLERSFCDVDSTATFKTAPDESGGLNLQMVTKIVGVNFYYNFSFNVCESELARDYLLVPLMLANAEHEIREAELIKIIQSKDKELDDYKSQGAKLARNYLKTDVFSGVNFNKLIGNKNELGNDLMSNPDRSLHTKLSQSIHETCMKKYYSTLKECNETLISSKANSEAKRPIDLNEPEDFILKSNEENDGSESERLLELEMKLKEQASKNRTPKKKKLF